MKRDVKKMQRRGKNMNKLTLALDLIASRRKLPEKYRDHQLKGTYSEFRECHIEPDWLLIYRILEDELILIASGTGSHADLFDE
jgi:mRNA interferase YafQ